MFDDYRGYIISTSSIIIIHELGILFVAKQYDGTAFWVLHTAQLASPWYFDIGMRQHDSFDPICRFPYVCFLEDTLRAERNRITEPVTLGGTPCWRSWIPWSRRTSNQMLSLDAGCAMGCHWIGR